MGFVLVVIFAVVVLLGFTAFTGAPYLPSKRRDLDMVFRELCPLTKNDVVVDLGSGDGAVLRAARRYGATAVGYELGPVYYGISKLLARGDKKQRIYLKNYWHAAFPAKTSVVFVFSDSRDIQKVHTLVQQQATALGSPLKLVTHGFEVPGRTPAATQRAYHLYIVSPLRRG